MRDEPKEVIEKRISGMKEIILNAEKRYIETVESSGKDLTDEEKNRVQSDVDALSLCHIETMQPDGHFSFEADRASLDQVSVVLKGYAKEGNLGLKATYFASRYAQKMGTFKLRALEALLGA